MGTINQTYTYIFCHKLSTVFPGNLAGKTYIHLIPGQAKLAKYILINPNFLFRRLICLHTDKFPKKS